VIPGEPVSAFQQRLESALPGVPQVYFGLSHDRIGYIMPEDEWGRFVLRRPGEAHEGGNSWAQMLEKEYLSLANEILE
jgi:hypothetical protein